MYRGYLVLKQAMDEGLFDPENRAKSKFAFSHLWTALPYKSVQEFLGVTQDQLLHGQLVPKKNYQKPAELMLWLYGSKEDDIEPEVRSQNPHLREMAEVLESTRGLQFLRSGQPLAVALEAARGDSRLFQDAISKAEAELRSASRFVATGFSGELLETATNIEKLAKTLASTMRRQTPEYE